MDISMAIRAGMPAFPGDPEVAMRPVRRIEQGDPYNLSTWTLGSHAGTHVDPPLHFLSDGAAADRLDLKILNGRCHVVAIPPDRVRIDASDLVAVPAGAERVLFRTSNSDRWASVQRFFDDFVALSAEAAGALVAKRVRLVGIDALSIESDPSGRFPVHHALLGSGQGP